ncbi:hypothetical protein BLJAPNOD_06759 [Ensifer sp. M14]|nr:hypothetical protein BLJAPNOD_06759 [Ensifer sp. M14]
MTVLPPRVLRLGDSLKCLAGLPVVRGVAGVDSDARCAALLQLLAGVAILLE